MRKVIFACLCFVSLGFSQEKNSSVILKLGANTSFYTGKISEWKGGLSYNLGVAYDVQISEKVSFVPGIEYVRLNAERKNPEVWNGISVDDKLTSSLISLPLSFQYSLTEKVDFILGPQVNYWAYASRKRDGNRTTEKPLKRINSFDYGLTGGVAYNFYKKYGVELKYYYGFSDLDEYPGSFSTSGSHSDIGKNSVLSLLFSYKL